MAPRHEDETDQKKRLIGRRTLLKLTGAAAVGTGLSATFGNAYAQTIDLGAKGLSPGDDLSPYLDTHWRSGNEVHIPGGTYKLSNPASLAITADQDSKLVGDGQVIADHGRTSNNWNVVAKGSAHVRIENITLKGKDTGGNSKIRPFATSKGG